MGIENLLTFETPSLAVKVINVTQWQNIIVNVTCHLGSLLPEYK
jgi:hypothetical protein